MPSGSEKSEFGEAPIFYDAEPMAEGVSGQKINKKPGAKHEPIGESILTAYFKKESSTITQFFKANSKYSSCRFFAQSAP